MSVSQHFARVPKARLGTRLWCSAGRPALGLRIGTVTLPLKALLPHSGLSRTHASLVIGLGEREEVGRVPRLGRNSAGTKGGGSRGAGRGSHIDHSGVLPRDMSVLFHLTLYSFIYLLFSYISVKLKKLSITSVWLCVSCFELQIRLRFLRLFQSGAVCTHFCTGAITGLYVAVCGSIQVDRGHPDVPSHPGPQVVLAPPLASPPRPASH